MTSSTKRRPPRGVNLIGYLRAESGVGEHARTLLAALDSARITTVPIDFGDTRSRRDHPLPPGTAEDPLFDCHLLCVNADQTPHFVARFGETRLGRATRVGYWHWEVEEFPDWMAASAAHVDVVWTASRHSADAIRKKVDRPVVVVPPVVDPPAPAAVPPGIVPAGRGPLFLTCFDYDSVLDRKNPVGTIVAFRRAFREDSGARLLVKSVNGSHHPERQLEVLEAAAGRADISIADRFLSRAEQEGLIHACDVFVSLHRAEGFGLMLAEAMAARKAVVATGYSGNLEFMASDTGILVPWTHREIPAGAGPYTGQWAEPDLDAAAEALSRLFRDVDYRAELGERAARSIRDLQSAEARALQISRELRQLPESVRDAAQELAKPMPLRSRLERWRRERAARRAGRERRRARRATIPARSPASG